MVYQSSDDNILLPAYPCQRASDTIDFVMIVVLQVEGKEFKRIKLYRFSDKDSLSVYCIKFYVFLR